MAIKPRTKADITVNHVMDERGRVIEPQEFYQIMTNPDFFKDRYDPRRLCLGLLFTTGIRLMDGVQARMAWFNKDFTVMQMSQCKAHKAKEKIECPRCKGKKLIFDNQGKLIERCLMCNGEGKISSDTGKIHLKTQPRFVPLPDWLSADLQSFMEFRMMVGVYIGERVTEGLLFPKLSEECIHNMFRVWRKKLGNKYKWLCDIWRIERGYKKDGTLLWEVPIYRIASHAGRAHYCTAAYLACDKDIKAAQVLSGHEEVDHLQRYIKVYGLQQKKEDIKKRFMNPLCSVQPTPLLVGQKTLGDFD